VNRDEVREIVDECLARCPLMCEDEVRALVRSTVKETLTTLGVDEDDPLEVQRDLAWVRDVRKASASARAKAGTALIGLLVAAVAGACWLGFKTILMAKAGP
jgi:hypothetical protein